MVGRVYTVVIAKSFAGDDIYERLQTTKSSFLKKNLLYTFNGEAILEWFKKVFATAISDSEYYNIYCECALCVRTITDINKSTIPDLSILKKKH